MKSGRSPAMYALATGAAVAIVIAVGYVLVVAPSATQPGGEGPPDEKPPEAPPWLTEIVSNDEAEYPSLALDSSGRPHVAYHDGRFKSLKYATLVDSTWTNETVDSDNAGKYASIAVDSTDTPHIAYSGAGGLKHTKWTGSEWSTQLVYASIANARELALALDSQNNPHIAYIERANPDLIYAIWDGSSWNVTNFTFGFYSESIGLSMALDSDDDPHLAYFISANDSLGYAKWNGVSWDSQILVDVKVAFTDTSMRIDSNGNPHISFYGRRTYSENGNLRYAKWTGSSWAIETVDASGTVGKVNSLALDSQDHAHIAYTGSARLKYATWTGDVWEIQPVGGVGSLGSYVSVAVDSSDSPLIVYQHRNSSISLRYAYPR